ncbi:MAG: NUDIX domain-containing protein [Alphaproteobacteria bacterium]
MSSGQIAQHIRSIVVAVIKKDNKVLAMPCFDKIKNEVFYRLPGGGIEFGEKAQTALKREFLEEIGINVNIEKQLPTVENIFEFNGKNGHEIVIPFEATLDDEEMLKDKFSMIEKEHEGKFIEFIEITKDKRIYPEVL